ncbi:hypothetical protein [Fodinicola feengrottensis]|uniref:hypothetical protein n=1 Tax=Fodinicola feengrottensis TaxID=435914 RepID=UPI0024424FFE|nr:hypothetical protein [Fodinicola feengrottensis]
MGSAAALVMVIVALLVRDSGLPFLPAVVVALVLGSILGTLNGLLVAYGRVHPIIITFGTLNIYRFVSLQIFNSQDVTGVPPTLQFFGGGGAVAAPWGCPTPGGWRC